MQDLNVSAEILHEYQRKLLDLLQYGEENKIPNAMQYGLINWIFLYGAAEVAVSNACRGECNGS